MSVPVPASDARRALQVGRAYGLFGVVQLVLAPIATFRLIAPVFAAPGFEAHAAALAGPLRAGAALLVALSAAGVAMAWFVRSCAPAWPRLGRAYQALSIAAAAVVVVEAGYLLGMPGLSAAHLAGTAPAEAVNALRAGHDVAHHLALMLGGVGEGLFFLLAARAGLLPRPLAVAGVVAAAIMAGTTGHALVGGRVNFALLGPIGLVEAVTAIWCLWRGFAGRATVGA
jgi:hypothetical protein